MLSTKCAASSMLREHAKFVVQDVEVCTMRALAIYKICVKIILMRCIKEKDHRVQRYKFGRAIAYIQKGNRINTVLANLNRRPFMAALIADLICEIFVLISEL